MLSIILPVYNEESNIENTSYILSNVSGGCCKSQSITAQTSPVAWESPAKIAASFPKFLEND